MTATIARISIAIADAHLEIAALKGRLAEQAEEVRALRAARPEEKEKPSGTQYGCYRFADDDGLYCTGCYDSKGQKSRTTRLNSTFRMCPVCQAIIGA